MSTPTKKLAIKTSDGDIFHVTEEVASQFKKLKRMMEDFGSTNPEEGEIWIPEVDSSMLSLIVSWGENHVCGKAAAAHPREWETEFGAKLDRKTLYLLLLAADFLEGAELVAFLAMGDYRD